MKFKPFQIRWKEKLGLPDCPYLIRYTLIFFNYSIRIHHWIRSDDRRFFHDHSCDFVSFILKMLKEAVAKGEVVTVFSPGPFGCTQNGRESNSSSK